MRFRWAKSFCLCYSSLALLSSVAAAAVTFSRVNAPTYEDDISHFAASSTGSLLSGLIDSLFRVFNLSQGLADEVEGSRDDMMVFDVSASATPTTSNATAKPLVLLISIDEVELNSDDERPLFIPIAAMGSSATAAAALSSCGAVGSTCYFQDFDITDDSGTNNTDFPAFSFGAGYSPGSILRVGIYPKDICAVVGALITTGELTTTSVPACDGLNVNDPVTEGAAQEFRLKFNFRVTADTTHVTAESGKTDEVSEVQTIRMYGNPPASVSCTGASSLYFPGDSEILVNTNNVNGSTQSAGAPLDSVVAIARKATTGSLDVSASFRTGNDVVGTALIDTGEKSITGFENTTDGTDNLYHVGLALRDKAGILNAFDGTNCLLDDVASAQVAGFLSGSNCFLVTAAFHQKEGWTLDQFRKFRDQILWPTILGRKLVQTYYRFSPIAAQWIIERPHMRLLVLLLLIPVEAVILTLLYGKWIFLALSLLSLVWFFRSRRLGFILILALPYGVSAQSNQPFIDEIRKQIAEEEADEELPQATADDPNPYINHLKKQIAEDEDPDEKPSESYIEEIKKNNPEFFGKEEVPSHIEEKKKEIDKREAEVDPEDKLPDSAIQAVHEGKSELQLKRPGDIKSAIGFRLGTFFSNSTTARAEYATNRSFEDVYGTGFHTDFSLFYERQLFHSEVGGSLGLMGGLGVSIHNGRGQFAVNLAIPGTGGTEFFGTESRTKLTFITIPTLLGVNYRLNLLRLIRPYVAGGGSFIGFIEDRTDSQPTVSGFSYGYFVTGGVAILLDWLSKSSAWSLYQQNGVKHYYLTVEYTRINSIGGAVNFGISGIYSGITFEI